MVEADVKAYELRELWRRYKEDGDESARERLVVAYSPLVKFVAGRTGARLPSHVEQSDLISYGMLGLIEAMDRFEPERRIRFARWTGCRARSARAPVKSRRRTRSSSTSSDALRPTPSSPSD